jgi:V/A-type H+/Na+-transporting ATPase subunit I
MIVRMAKVKIIGPKESLLEVLTLVREMGVFQVEPNMRGFIAKGEERAVRSHLLDKETLGERLYFEELRRKIDELAACLPQQPARQSYLEPRSAVAAIAALVDKHCATCRQLCRKRDALRHEREELHRQTVFLDALEPLLKGVAANTALDFIGVTIRDPAATEHLMRLLAKLTGGRFEIVTTSAADGTTIALITLVRELADQVRQVLNAERVPELSFPAEFQDLSLPEKIRRMRQRLAEVAVDLDRVDSDIQRFAMRWAPTYQWVREWLDDRLSLLTTTAAIHETSMCFFIHGWIPVPDVERLRTLLNGNFGGRVVVEEKQVLEEDLEKVPVTIRNPAYFRPFELFTRLLPLPFYTSYDPTPFIGVFFPIFFGMILGDVGYGLVILVAALLVRKMYGRRHNLRDAATILLVSSCYAIVFGFLYGEFFGGLGPAWLFLEKTLVVERRRAVMPMLIFSVSVGVAHVTLGLLLGFWGALRRRAVKEALFKLVNVLVVLCLAALAVSFFAPFPQTVTRTINLAVLVAIPIMLLTGGLLAPLEMLKNIGNIISYARIMAIGLASVLIADVANRFAGWSGDIVFGAVAAGLLHLINLVLGVFSPTIHALRLHYVEFFGKFMTYGGRRFEPYQKPRGKRVR